MKPTKEKGKPVDGYLKKVCDDAPEISDKLPEVPETIPSGRDETETEPEPETEPEIVPEPERTRAEKLAIIQGIGFNVKNQFWINTPDGVLDRTIEFFKQ